MRPFLKGEKVKNIYQVKGPDPLKPTKYVYEMSRCPWRQIVDVGLKELGDEGMGNYY